MPWFTRRRDDEDGGRKLSVVQKNILSEINAVLGMYGGEMDLT